MYFTNIMKYLIPILFLFSCNSVKKAGRQLNRIYANNPEIIASKTRSWFPCIPVEVKRDSTKYVAFLSHIDTLLKVDTISEKCPERQVLIKYKEILKRPPAVHDTIKIKDLSNEAIIGDLSAQNSKLKDIIAKGQKWIISLLIALCVSIIAHFIRKR